jgi:hypothetical protein
VRYHSGVFQLSDDSKIVYSGPADGPASSAARSLHALVTRDADRGWTLGPSGGPSTERTPDPKTSFHGSKQGIVSIERVDREGRRRGEQWYSLRIRPTGIRLRAGAVAGLRFGVLTLGQLIGSGCRAIRSMDLEDWPDFAVRGVMLDISRDQVPKLSTLQRLIDMLAGWKINQLQLYTEHTFAYTGHQRVWAGASPMTGDQIEQLDRYCRQRGVELVPNQNSFGHMERWLRHPPYADLAEADGPWKTPWGEYRSTPTTLNPLDPRSIRLVRSLYEQLLPRFSSRLFNVGGDETWELGQGRSKSACRRKGVGRVYLDFLLKLHRAVRGHGRRMMFWGDIVQHHPELIAELPRDVIPLIWGYEADHPFAAHCRRLAGRGLDFYVCPGTSSWCSFGGRTENCLANLHRAAVIGKRHGASGYLITDWGDFGHRQYLPVSYCGFLYGAAVSWGVKANGSIDVARQLSRHAFQDLTGVTGRLWCAAGKVHQLSGVALKNRTVLFAGMQASMGQPGGVEGLTEERICRMERRVAELAARAGTAPFGGSDGELVREELQATLAVLGHACRRAAAALAVRNGHSIRRRCRRLAAEMTTIIERHRELWLARNRRGGLADSLSHYRRNLREYQLILGQTGR